MIESLLLKDQEAEKIQYLYNKKNIYMTIYTCDLKREQEKETIEAFFEYNIYFKELEKSYNLYNSNIDFNSKMISDVSCINIKDIVMKDFYLECLEKSCQENIEFFLNKMEKAV